MNPLSSFHVLVVSAPGHTRVLVSLYSTGMHLHGTLRVWHRNILESSHGHTISGLKTPLVSEHCLSAHTEFLARPNQAAKRKVYA